MLQTAAVPSSPPEEAITDWDSDPVGCPCLRNVASEFTQIEPSGELSREMLEIYHRHRPKRKQYSF